MSTKPKHFGVKDLEVIDMKIPEAAVDQATASEFGVDPIDFGKFMLAIELSIYLAQGFTMGEACEKAGENERTWRSAKHREIMRAAQSWMLKDASTIMKNAASAVYNAWPKIANSLVTLALTAKLDRDKIAAAQLLSDIYPISEQTQTDVSAQTKFLARPHNFSPMISTMKPGDIMEISIKSPGVADAEIIADPDEPSEAASEPDTEQ